MVILGIDIGINGAVAVLTGTGDLIAIHNMPTLADGPAGRRAVNAALLASLIYESHARSAFVELVNAWPGEGAVGAFSFGRSRGVIEGALAAAGVPCRFITPTSWKRAVGIPFGKAGAKDAARSKAIARWPEHAAMFARKCDDGRAEAALIAAAGLKVGSR